MIAPVTVVGIAELIKVDNGVENCQTSCPGVKDTYRQFFFLLWIMFNIYVEVIILLRQHDLNNIFNNFILCSVTNRNTSEKDGQAKKKQNSIEHNNSAGSFI